MPFIPALEGIVFAAGPYNIPIPEAAMIFRLYKTVIWIQGGYTLLTALWAIMDIDSFMLVTGPKMDIWLVKTVSAVLVAIAVCLLSALAYQEVLLPIILLGGTAGLALAIIDFYYALRHVISGIYMLDGVAEVVFFLIWLYIWLRYKRAKA